MMAAMSHCGGWVTELDWGTVSGSWMTRSQSWKLDKISRTASIFIIISPVWLRFIQNLAYFFPVKVKSYRIQNCIFVLWLKITVKKSKYNMHILFENYCCTFNENIFENFSNIMVLPQFVLLV